MADQHNSNIPAVGNQISADIPDIKENLEYHKDVFEAFVNDWSDSTATNIKPKIVGDADNDTLIQCEESADEDIIRFDIGGTEQITVQDGKIEPTTDNDIDLGATTKEFKNLYIDGVAYLDQVNTDVIAEQTAATGVTIDGLLIKDGAIGTANAVDSDVYVDGSIDEAHLASSSVTNAKIGANAVTADKLSHGLGTIWLRASEETADTHAGTSYTDRFTTKILMPSGPTAIRLYAEIKSSGAGTTAYARLGVGTTYSAGGSRLATTYLEGWTDCGTVDVSGLTPGTVYDLKVQTYISQTHNVSLAGFAIWWE